MGLAGLRPLAGCLAAIFISGSAIAETPEEWVKLGARVHGGFGAFILGSRVRTRGWLNRRL